MAEEPKVAQGGTGGCRPRQVLSKDCCSCDAQLGLCSPTSCTPPPWGPPVEGSRPLSKGSVGSGWRSLGPDARHCELNNYSPWPQRSTWGCHGDFFGWWSSRCEGGEAPVSEASYSSLAQQVHSPHWRFWVAQAAGGAEGGQRSLSFPDHQTILGQDLCAPLASSL